MIVLKDTKIRRAPKRMRRAYNAWSYFFKSPYPASPEPIKRFCVAVIAHLKNNAMTLLLGTLEFSTFWCTWKRNHIADVGHAGYKQDEPFEAEAEAAVGC